MDSLSVSHIDFWDVGQGDCSVVHFSDSSILLIDVGPKTNPLIQWLKDKPRKIRGVVLTHNDADHSGALCSLVEDHNDRIEGIWMLQDRDKNDRQFEKLFNCALKWEKAGKYKIQRAEAGRQLWKSESQGLCLQIVHPSFSESIEANNPNRHSAMIVLSRHASPNDWLIGWPGDLELKTVAAHSLGTTLKVMMGPHHGAPSDRKPKSEVRANAASISPMRSFISVGATNRYNHPSPRYVQSLALAGTHVVCSQITNCCDRAAVQSKSSVFPGSALLGLPQARGVACRGAWRIHLNGMELVPDPNDELHLARVALLHRPMCLKGRGWKSGDAPLSPISLTTSVC